MKCRHFLSFVFVAFSVFFSGLFITTQNSFALSDIVITVDDSNYNSVDFSCGSDCSSYHFLLIDDLSGSGGFNYSFCPLSSDPFARLILSHNSGLYSVADFFLFSFDNIDQMRYCASSWTSGTSFKATLSENNPFGSSPVGDISITLNGTYDVSSYATATVDVPTEVTQGDYHNDLVNIQKSIIVCGAILLVLYFFYCIYRLIIKNSGVR